MKDLNEDNHIEKKQIRQVIRLALHRMSDNDYAGLNAEIHRNFFDLEMVRQASVIMIYYSIVREVETVSLIEGLLIRGKRVGLPVCREDSGMDVREIRGLNDVETRKLGKLSLFEPTREMPLIHPEQLELIILPGLAFDRRGNRLGHGAGYYDRFLDHAPNHIFKLGLAYGFQVISEVPVSHHDVKVDGLLTEARYIDCRL